MLAKPIEDFVVVSAMRRYGGSFVRALGEACACADPENLTKLKAAFPEYWAEYTNMAQMLAARATAGQE